MNTTSGATENRIVPCLAGAGFFGVVCLSLEIYLWPGLSLIALIAWAALFAFGVFCGLLLLLSLPAVITIWLEHRAYWHTLRVSDEVTAQVGPGPVIEQAPQHLYESEWRAYWLAALDYAAQVGGVSYQRTKDFFGSDHAIWRECFILPLVRVGYVNPVQAGVETTTAPGWSIEKIRWAIESNRSNLTAPPFKPPAKFNQQPTVATENNSEKTVAFAADS